MRGHLLSDTVCVSDLTGTKILILLNCKDGIYPSLLTFSLRKRGAIANLLCVKFVTG